MPRYLIVAHETVTSGALAERVRQVAREDPAAEFVLLVPATPVRHLLRRPQSGEAQLVAARRAEEGRKFLTGKGVRLVDAKVGASSPVEAVDAEVAAYPSYAGFVVSTLPKEQSRWLRQDLPGQIRERHGKPVHHVELDPEDVPYLLP
jgi:hypothetical protein